MENNHKKLSYLRDFVLSSQFVLGFLIGMIVMVAFAIIIDNNKAFYYNSNEISKGDRYVVSSFRDPETGGRYLIIKGQDKELVVIPDKDTYYEEISK